MATSAAKLAPNLAEVFDAMASINTESDRWHLAEALAKQIPSGASYGGVSFADILDAATKQGVAGKLSTNTLRLYRDTASRWPADKRVAGVSFSAHREMRDFGDVSAQAKALEALVKSEGGADKVTVASVRRAIKTHQGKAVNPPGAAISKKAIDVVEDLKKGAPELIGSIPVGTTRDELDKIHAGLNKALAYVEKLRARAAQRKASATKPTPQKAPAAPAAGTTKKVVPIAAGKGDLRGL
jgi:hypothetical protein